MLSRWARSVGHTLCGRYRKPMTDEDPRYAQLRSQWNPSRVKLLIIAESAPADGGDVSARRFFYADRLGPDNLFRGVVGAMYGASKMDLQRTGKRPWLERLRDDGFFLIDLAQYPVNALSAAERRRVLHEAFPGCVARASALDPVGVVVVKADPYTGSLISRSPPPAFRSCMTVRSRFPSAIRELISSLGSPKPGRGCPHSAVRPQNGHCGGCRNGIAATGTPGNVPRLVLSCSQ